MFNPLFMPMSWRKITPLHRKLGARAVRYNYPAGVGLPLTASPQTINTRYGAEAAIDRIIGFTFSIQTSAIASNFYLQENNTGWQFSFDFGGNKGVFCQANIETLPDEVDLTWSFSANPNSNVYLAFYNFEVVPFELV